MKITSIKQQQKNSSRYSVFVEGKYSFSLSETALLESKIASGQELSIEQVREFKKVSADDKIYNRALRYVALRSRSTWEVQQYLEKKGASPTLVDYTLNKLSDVGLLDDYAFTKAFVHDRQLLRPTSLRKLTVELRKKRVPENIVQSVLAEERLEEKDNLRHVITTKRKQEKYKDDKSLMSYLARQGFNYSDIKTALEWSDQDV